MTQNTLYDPQRGWRQWRLADIYTGPSGTGLVVPNPDDLIFDKNTGYFIITAVDPATYLSTMVAWIPPNQVGGASIDDAFLGAGPGTQSQSFRVYVNTDVTPHPMAVCPRLRKYGPSAAYCKIFAGSDISSSGVVLSATVDGSGNIISENLGFDTAVDGRGTPCKTPSEGVCVENVDTGDEVTLVTYNSSGAVIDVERLLVSVTDFVRSLDASRKYITGIQLVTPYLSPSDNTLVLVPVNTLLSSLSFQCKVSYSDGTSNTVPIDGTKVQMAGLGDYVANRVGQEVDIGLVYNFSDSEYGYNLGDNGGNRFLAVSYTVTTTDLVGAQSVKIYVVPSWNPNTNHYDLKYYLYNLDRAAVYDVTQWVTLVSPNNVYNPTPTNTPQTLTLRLDLSQIGQSYAYYIYTSTVTLTLIAAGNTNSPKWSVQYSDGGVQYGGANAAVFTNTSGNNWNVDLSTGRGVEADWLTAIYGNAEPLFNPITEVQPLVPTHFIVKFGKVAPYTATIPMANWNQPLVVSLTPSDPQQGDTVLLEFIVRTGQGDLQVGMGYMPININS